MRRHWFDDVLNKRKGRDIQQPLPTPEIREYTVPLKPPPPSRTWEFYQRTPRHRRWLMKERQA